MQCPNCPSLKLEPHEIEPGLIGAGCKACQGLLLSLMYYRHWRDHYDNLDDMDSGDALVEETEGIRLCPKCGKMMTKYRIDAEISNRLDLCGHCDEAWLDKGEWQLLKRLEVHKTLPSLFTDAWQLKIRKRQEIKSLQAHYSKRIGEADFEKVRLFKEWMDNHSQSPQIKLYLNTKLLL